MHSECDELSRVAVINYNLRVSADRHVLFNENMSTVQAARLLITNVVITSVRTINDE